MSSPNATSHAHPLVQSVARSLRGRCGVREGDRLIAAVSGGADSVALLRALATLGPRRGWGLTIAVGHVQHHLRDAAEQDAAMVAKLAEALDLPFMRADIDLHPEKNADDNLEARARRERYDALLKMAEAFDACAVVTAHHGDDQLETILMRLLRGASVRGLSGMAWRRPLAAGSAVKLIRPMLNTDHDTAVDYLRAIDQPWCEDHTNHEGLRVRSQLRTQVLASLKAAHPGAPRKAVQLADHLREVSAMLERAIDVAADRVIVTRDAAALDRIEARAMPSAVLTGLLRRLATQAGAGADRLGGRTMRPIVRAIHDTTGGERRFDLGAGVRVRVTRGEVTVTGSMK